MARCECAGCGELFGGVEAFDRHQQPAGTCHPPGNRGLVRAPDGRWGTGPMSPEALSRLRGRPRSGQEASLGVLGTPGPETGSQGRAGAL
jgi:hypothetical protein